MRQSAQCVGLLIYMLLVAYLLFFVLMPSGFAGVAWASIAVFVFVCLSSLTVLLVRDWKLHAFAISVFWISVGVGSVRSISGECIVLLLAASLHASIQISFAVAAAQDRRNVEQSPAGDVLKAASEE